MKIEWAVTDLTPVGSSDRAGCDSFGMILDSFWAIQATFVAGEPLCDVRPPS